MSGHYDQFILFGDSITEAGENEDISFAFVSGLRQEYNRRIDVVNRGFSGYNTELALQVLKYIIPDPKVAKMKLFVVFFGANDCCFPLEKRNQCVPLVQFKQNLLKIFQDDSVMAHNTRMMVITPPPVDERLQRAIDFDRGYPVRRSAANTKEYVDVTKEAAAELDVPVVDLWGKVMKIAGWDEANWAAGDPLPGSQDLDVNKGMRELLSDGLHLTAEGYRVLYDEFRKVLRENFPELASERLSKVYPPWDEFPSDGWTGPRKSTVL